MKNALTEITEVFGVVNFSSHNQMKEAIENAMAIAETELEVMKNDSSISERMREIWGLDNTHKAERHFSQSQIEQLQSKVHSITGDGEVMIAFNTLLGVNAG